MIGIVSHSEDLDGIVSGLLLSYYSNIVLGRITETKFVNYQELDATVLELAPRSDHFYMADLSQRNEQLSQAFAHLDPSKVHIYDHHKDSMATMDLWLDKATIHYTFNKQVCAADLVWEHLKPEFDKFLAEQTRMYLDEKEFHAKVGFKGETLHRFPGEIRATIDALEFLVQAAHSRDLWIKDVPEGCLLSDMLDVIGYEAFFKMLWENPSCGSKENFTPSMERYLIIAQRKLERSKKIAKSTSVSESVHKGFLEIKIIAALCDSYSSEVGHTFLSEYPYTIVGMIDIDSLQLSFRTNQETIDILGFGVNEIAKTFGGGGHPVAAGAPMSDMIIKNGPTYFAGFIKDHILSTERSK